MLEPTQIQCPHCGQPYFVQPGQWPQYQGRTINCTRCGQAFTVTPPGEMSAAQQAPAFPGPPQAQMPPPPGYGPSPPPGYPPPFAPYPPYPGAMYPTPPAATSGWAIASLISGLVLFCVPVLGGLVATIIATIGIAQTRQGRLGGRGLAIAGLVLGLLSLVLATPAEIAVMVPAMGKVREKANQDKCATHMRNLGTAMMNYANAHDAFPDKLEELARLTAPPMAADFICPDDDKTPPAETPSAAMAADIAGGKHCSFIYVGKGVKGDADAKTVLLYEPLGNHKREGMNVLFADGHVEWLTADEAQAIIDQKNKGVRSIKREVGG